MARFKADQADNYGGQGGAGFFSLRNDGDVARVRFMYGSINDVEGMSVHQVELNEKKRYVNCLREYSDPVSKCPFCREHMPVQAKLFVPIYDVDEDRVKIWERGKKFFNKISGLCSRYPRLVEKEFEIERHGKAGDTNTTYEIFPMDDSESVTLEELPEIPADFKKFVLDKSADDMEYFLDAGEFPPEENNNTTRRRSGRRAEPEDDVEDVDDELPFGNNRRREQGRQSTRRTPASRRKNSEDAFD